MKRFTWILFALLLSGFSGCPKPNNHGPKPTRTPTVAPTPDSRPAIVDVGEHRELRIGGAKALALGTYHLAVDPAYLEGAIRQALRGARENGFNLIRVFAFFPWMSSYLTPWAKTVDSRWDLDEIDPAYLARLDLVGRLADEEGVCIAWVCWDGYSIRRGAAHDALNPRNHIVAQRLFHQVDWEPGSSIAPRAREPWKCRADNIEIGSRQNPVWWVLVQNVANIASRHNDLVYLWNEMHTDEEHATWDTPAMRWWTEEGVRHVRSIYPGLIIGTSIGVIGSDPQADLELEQSICGLVDIIDSHHLGALSDCQSHVIPSSVSALRAECPSIVVCANDDGCMDKQPNGVPYRETAAWCIDVGRAAWGCGAFPEYKTDYPFAVGVLEAGRTLRGEEYGTRLY